MAADLNLRGWLKQSCYEAARNLKASFEIPNYLLKAALAQHKGEEAAQDGHAYDQPGYIVADVAAVETLEVGEEGGKQVALPTSHSPRGRLREEG